MSKVIFKVADDKVEAQCIYKFRKHVNKDYNKIRNADYFKFELQEEIKNLLTSEKKFDEIKEALDKLVKSIRPEIKEEDINRIKDEWHKVEQIFFREIESMTGEKCSYDKYICYMIFSVCGHYEKDNNLIFSEVTRKPQISAAICAEELLHLHYWRCFEKIFNCKEHNIQQWKMSEVMPDYFLMENRSFEHLGWNKMNRSKGYPWITELRKILDPIWKSRKNFKDFMIRAHKMLDCMPLEISQK